MDVVDNSPQESALSVIRGPTGSRVRPELIRRPDGRLHHHMDVGANPPPFPPPPQLLPVHTCCDDIYHSVGDCWLLISRVRACAH